MGFMTYVDADRVLILANRFTTAELCRMSMQAALVGRLKLAEECRQAVGERIVKER